tara:strand:+ start:759 stop:1340 length:582 start_codon:yes stop_codon:yes gene_type:complete
MAKKYFLADLDDLPNEFKNGKLSHYSSHSGKFAVCGCEEADYDTHIAPLKSGENKKPIEDIVDEETALEASRCWGDTREKRSLWSGDTDVDKYPTKSKVSITDDQRAKTLTVMKQAAKMIVQLAIDEGEGDPYNASLLTDIENTATVTQINIIYENYLGQQLCRKDATDLNKYESDGYTRKYDASRVKPSCIQ